MPINNKQVQKYSFLAELSPDPKFPNDLVDQGKAILVELCAQIEAQQPANLEEFYVLTQAATEQFNQLEALFQEKDSEQEMIVREAIALDMVMISLFYDYAAEAEDMIDNRTW